MRYIRQRDSYSCGPVGIINILKWLGRSCTYKDLKRVSKLCDCTGTGTNNDNMNKAFRILGIENDFTTHLNFLNITEHLDEGIILFDTYVEEDETEEGHYHFFLCTDYDDEYFYVVNESWGETHSYLTWQELEDYLEHENGCAAWFIRR